jgi:hypothetical protein
MTQFRRLVCICTTVAVALCAYGAIATAASATTFYVDNRGEGKDHCLGEHFEDACATIRAAVEQAEASPGANTIEVASANEPYKEALGLTAATDKGLTVNGDEEGVEIEDSAGPLLVAGAAGAITLSNLEVKTATGVGAAIVDHGVALTLDDVAIESESGEGIDGVEAREGSVTMDGGSVTMENGASGYGISAVEAKLALNGVKILNGPESSAEAGGVFSEKSALTIENSGIGIESGLPIHASAVYAVKDTSVSLENDQVKQSNSEASGVTLADSPASVNGLSIAMLDPASTAIGLATLQLSGSSTFSHLETSGTWRGAGAVVIAPSAVVSESHIASNASASAAALVFASPEPAAAGLLLQRSVVQAPAAAGEGALFVEGGNATLDSSEILGGANGVTFENKQPGTVTLTVSGSTIDAGAPGISADSLGVNGVSAEATTEPGSVVKVAIQGSIVLERQAAQVEAGDQASVGCDYSAVPSQTQAASGATGAIACASGTSGNIEINPLSGLFAEPLANYQLIPTSGAVAGVPAGALTLPFGFAPSATDLAGNARAGDGHDACFTSQDMGALELQGQLVSCPTPPATTTTTTTTGTAKPLVGVLSALAISPSAFLAAPSGATVSALAASKKKHKYGAKIGYRDSQTATTTFTVLVKSSGRMQGKSCRKPSKKNAHGKRCTILRKLGGFTHTDVAGANSLHFSGRLKGRELAPGSYELQAVAHDAAGNGNTVEKSFTIV